MYNFVTRNRIIEIEKTDDPALAAEKERLYSELRQGCAHEIILEAVVGTTQDQSHVTRVCTICGLHEDGTIDDVDVAHGFNKLVKSLPILRTIFPVQALDLERYQKLQPSSSFIPHRQGSVPPPVFHGEQSAFASGDNHSGV